MKAKTVSPSINKVVSTAKNKLAISNQAIHDIVVDSFKGKRIAYFVLDTERSKNGAFLLCVAIEDETGFYRYDWDWHCSFATAKARAKEMNELLGLTDKDVTDIVISTMELPNHQ